jgi:nicotinamide phosphoribosyltransferase
LRPFAPHLTDFYKTGHIRQYPTGTEYVYANFTPRSDKWANVLPDFDHKVVWFGLQAVAQWLLIDLWKETFFGIDKQAAIDRYKRRMDSSLGPDVVGVEHIAALHDLGYLPVLIKALPEGSRVDIRVPLYTIVNTHPDFYWVTNYLETQLSAEIWKIMTSATSAYEYRRLLDRYAELTGADPSFVPFQGHDFSMRGMSGVWDATQSGAAHLLSFMGTDTISSIDYLEEYYPGNSDTFIGGSVPATEHSVMCMGGFLGEVDTFRRLITETYPAGIVSIVSDTWDFWKVIAEFTVDLKSEIMGRDGRVVFRPDSGDPVKIIVGDPNAPEGSAARKGAVECLWDVFGGTLTDKRYKTIDTHVGLIYGDSISLQRAQKILEGLKAKGFSSANIVFGIGSYAYQFATRDTFGTAIKATFGIVNGEPRELFKDPKTDDGTKKSARGLIRVEFEDGRFVMYDRQDAEGESLGLMEVVFCDGEVKRTDSLTAIRHRLLGGNDDLPA